MYFTDVTQIMPLADELEGFYSARNDLFAKLRASYLMIAPQTRPAGLPWYQTPSAHAAVNLFTDMLAANFPIMRVTPKGPSKDNVALAGQTERFLKGAWHRTERRTRTPLLRFLYWQAAVYGWMVTKVLYDTTVWGPEPTPKDWEQPTRYQGRYLEWASKREEQFPIKILVRQPKYVYPQPTYDDGYRYVIERYPRRVSDIRAQWGSDLLPVRQETDWVWWTEAWDDEAFAYLADGVVVQDLRAHNYGGLPIQIGRAFPVPDDDPKYQSLSLLYAVSDLVDYESELLSQQAAAIKRYSWPTILARWNGKDPQTGQPIRLDLTPGAINYLMEGESIEYLEWKGQQPAIEAQESSVHGHIDKSTFPALMYGQGVKSGLSGRFMQQVTNAPRLKTAGAKTQIEWLASDTNETMLRLVERMGVGVSIYAKGADSREKLTLYPDDIDGCYDNGVEIKPTLPEDELEKAAVGERLVQQGIISRETARDRYAGVADPVEEADKILLEKVMDMPLYQLWIALKLAKKHAVELGPVLERQIVQALQNAYQQATGAGSAQVGPAGAPGGTPPPPGAPAVPATPGVRAVGPGNWAGPQRGGGQNPAVQGARPPAPLPPIQTQPQMRPPTARPPTGGMPTANPMPAPIPR